MDGQVAYGSYRVATGNQMQSTGHGTLTRPPKTVNFDMSEDNYIDTLRRNAFAQGNQGQLEECQLIADKGKGGGRGSRSGGRKETGGGSRNRIDWNRIGGEEGEMWRREGISLARRLSDCTADSFPVSLDAGNNESMYAKSRQDPYYNPSPINDPSARYGTLPTSNFHQGPTSVSNRFNPLSESVASASNHSPYTPMGSLNIPAANGIYGPSAGRIATGLPVNLPLPLPMSMQGGHHHPVAGHFTSFNPNESGPSPIMEQATAQFSGPSLATVRSLETEGHLV